jgi:hypothetical protein
MTGKYTLIYADPPWVYRDKAAGQPRRRVQISGHERAGYLPAVWDLAAGCLLAMWWVPTQPVEALKVVEAWGSN